MICVFLGASSSLLVAESPECELWSFDLIYVCNVLLLSHFCIILFLCSFFCDDLACRGFRWNLAFKLMIDLPWMSECFGSVVFDCLIWLLCVRYVLMLKSFIVVSYRSTEYFSSWLSLDGWIVWFECFMWIALLLFDVYHFLRFVGLCLFFVWWLTLSRFPMKPHPDVNEWPSLDVWVFECLLNRRFWKPSREIVFLVSQVFGVCVLSSSNRLRRSGLRYVLKLRFLIETKLANVLVFLKCSVSYVVMF